MGKITESEIITSVVATTDIDKEVVKKVSNALFEKIFQNLEKCQAVTIQNFGTFYIKATEPKRTFKFNPANRLRKVLGWSTK